MAIGEKIRRVRKERGYTQKQLAEKCKMYESQIRKYELGKANPKLETIEKIAVALNVAISDLLDQSTLNITNDMIDLFSDGSEIHDLGTTSPENFQEKCLLSTFRCLNESGQNKAIEQIEMITKIPEYLKFPLKK